MTNHRKFSIDTSHVAINDIMAAIIICFNLINGAIGIGGISYATIGMVFLLFFFGMLKKQTHIYMSNILTVFYILVVFLISFVWISDTQYTMYYFAYFAGFGIISLFIGSQSFSVEKVLHYIENIGMVCIVVLMIRGLDQYDPSLQMGISYSILPVFFSALITLGYEHTKKIQAFLVIFLSLYCYIKIAPRGIWLTIAIACLFYFYIVFGRKTRGATRLIIRGSYIVIIIITVLIVTQNLSGILSGANDMIFSVTGKRVYAFDKALFLLNSGNFGNGRGELNQLAKEIMKENFCFGHGIGYYELFSDGLYVHNVIYQSLCEAGLFFLIPVVAMLLASLKILFANRSNNNIIKTLFFMLLFVNGFVMLFYSSVYWQLLLFWFLLGYIITKRKPQ